MHSLIIAGLLALAAVQVASASHLINWAGTNGGLTPGWPDRGNFAWTNVTGSLVQWNGRVYWSSWNGHHGALQQSYAQHQEPHMEYEGFNPGMGTDCDNLNYYTLNGAIPRDSFEAKNEGSCPNNDPGIREQVNIFIRGSSVAANTTYDQYITWSKTYLSDYDPSWREVNLSFSDHNAYADAWLGKLKYDIQGSADGFPTNGRYALKCVSPPGAIDNTLACP